MLHAHGIVRQALRLRHRLLFACCVMFCSSLLRAEPSQPPSVSINLVGHDGLTQKLSSSLKRKVSTDRSLVLHESPKSSDYVVTSDTNVYWDTLEGKTIIIYHVKLLRDGLVEGDKVGACFENRIGKCTTDIINKFRNIILHSR